MEVNSMHGVSEYESIKDTFELLFEKEKKII